MTADATTVIPQPAPAAPPKARPRMEYLDIAKGFAAMFVVILHLFSDPVFFATLGPWHVWQAMPIFLLVAGITGAMSCRKYQGITGNLGWAKNKADLMAYYRTLPGKVLPLYIPYMIVTIFYNMWTGEGMNFRYFFETMVMGYLGPGGYFVPLIVQHLIIFPLVLSIRGKVGSDLKFLGYALAIAVVAEMLFAFVDVESSRFLYRIFYFRYLFGCCLGAVLADKNPFSKTQFYALVAMSAAYIWATCYLSQPQAIPPKFWNFFLIRGDDWYFQHYLGFFWTAFLVFSLRDYEARVPFVAWIKKMGQNSYEIFIFQMVFFITLGTSMKHWFGWADYPFIVKVLIFFGCLYGGLGITRAKAKWKEKKA